MTLGSRLLAAGVCPKAPPGMQGYRPGHQLGEVGRAGLIIMPPLVSIGSILIGRIFAHPHASRYGAMGLGITVICAILYVTILGILAGITGVGLLMLSSAQHDRARHRSWGRRQARGAAGRRCRGRACCSRRTRPRGLLHAALLGTHRPLTGRTPGRAAVTRRAVPSTDRPSRTACARGRTRSRPRRMPTVGPGGIPARSGLDPQTPA